MALTSCRTIQPSHEKIVIKSDTVRTIEKDSVYLFVSDTVHLFTKNDTVYQNTIKWRVKYSESAKIDTIIKTVTVKVNHVKVVAQMNKLQRIFYGIGIALSCILLTYIIIKVSRIFIR